MDYAAGGNLYEYLKKAKEPVDWRIRSKWAKQIAETLKFLHEKGVIHRDLRCVNILLTEKMDVRISDFGISLWKGSGEGTALPVYDGKEHYKLTNDKATLTFNFDLRLFGIVLAKLLLCGNDMDKDLWDTKSNSLMLSQLNCQYMPYLQLIELCLSPSSKIMDILDTIEAIVHDPLLPIPVEIIVPKLLEDLQNTVNDEARITAARALGDLALAEEKVVGPLIIAIHDSNTWVKRYAAKSLGNLMKKAANFPNKAEVTTALIKILDSNDEKSVRVEAIRVLGPLGAKDSKVIAALCKSSSDELPGVRMETAEALGEAMTDQSDVVTALIKLLNDSDGWVRMKAATALKKFMMTDSRVERALRERAEQDTDLGTKWAAQKSLQDMQQ